MGCKVLSVFLVIGLLNAGIIEGDSRTDNPQRRKELSHHYHVHIYHRNFEGSREDDQSCANRCGVFDQEKPCQCNPACVKYNDCCQDYYKNCDESSLHIHLHNDQDDHHYDTHQNYVVHIHEDDQHDDDHGESSEDDINNAKRFFGPLAGDIKTLKEMDMVYKDYWPEHAEHAGEQAGEHVYAHCNMHADSNYEGTKVSGKILFKQDRKAGKVEMKMSLHGFDPLAKDHGLHIHKYGDIGHGCSKYVGPHYNPFHTEHGAADDNIDHRHVGDLGNVHADDSGDVTEERKEAVISLTGPYNVIARAMVITENPDDISHTHDTSTEGAPMACCVITLDDGTDWNTE